MLAFSRDHAVLVLSAIGVFYALGWLWFEVWTAPVIEDCDARFYGES